MYTVTTELPIAIQSNYFGCRSRGDVAVSNHTDETDELFFLRQGKVSVKIGSQSFTLDSDQCIFIPASAEHSFTSLDALQPFFYDSVHFSVDSLCSPEERAFYQFYENLFQHKFGLTFVVSAVHNGEEVLSFLTDLVSLLKTKPPGYGLGCKAYLELILFKMMSMTEITETSIPAESGILPAISFIEANYINTIRVETLASVCCMSKYYFIRCFFHAMQQTPVEYINSYRIKIACRKLSSEQDEKIITVALAVGFHDLSNFNRTFKRIIGMTPTEYRANAAQNANNKQSVLYFESRTSRAPFYAFMP